MQVTYAASGSRCGVTEDLLIIRVIKLAELFGLMTRTVQIEPTGCCGDKTLEPLTCIDLAIKVYHGVAAAG